MKTLIKTSKLFTLLIFSLLLLAVPVSAEETGIMYKTHVENIGWQDPVSNGQTAGTEGRGLQIEALTAQLVNIPGDLEYNAHVQNIGWQTPVLNGAVIGTTGQNLHMEAINFHLYGGVENLYDIYYRSHIQDVGWLDWAKNGDNSGSSGGNKQMEALQVVIVPKDTAAPGPTENCFVDFNTLKTPSLASPSNTGALKVQGNQLISQNGSPVQLRGVSTHGLAWYPGYVNQALFNELKNNWNANVVRLAMYTSEYGGYCNGGDQEALKNLIRQGVDYATKADLYVIVDWHILSDGDPNQNKNAALDFFRQMSSEFANHNNVLYEICNEPNGNVSWESVKAYAQEVIPVIKANDPDAIIIVGSPTWSQRIDEAAQNPITGYDNIMYSLHFYAGTHKDELRNRMITAVQNGLPVFVSEFGITDASGNGALDIESANSWVNTMNNLGVSYVCWNLSNKDESSALFKSSCSKLSGFSNDDLSGQGQWLLEVLASPGLGNHVDIPTPGPSVPETPEPSNGQEATINGITFKVNQTNSWESGGNFFYQYEMQIINNTGNIVNSWIAHLNFSQNIELNGSWNGIFTNNGTKLQIENVDYNGHLDNGASTNIGFIVKAQKDLTLNIP